MNAKFLVFSLFFALILSFSAAAQSKRTNEVLETLKRYDAAWNKKDFETVGKILAAEYVYFSSIGGTSDYRQTVDFLKSPEYKLTFVERSEIKTYQTGETVVVSSRWKGKGSWSGGTIDDDQRCGQVFVRDGKAWKLASENCAQIVAK